jgi:hypothetical protein
MTCYNAALNSALSVSSGGTAGVAGSGTLAFMASALARVSGRRLRRSFVAALFVVLPLAAQDHTFANGLLLAAGDL